VVRVRERSPPLEPVVSASARTCVAAHDQALVQQLIDGLDECTYELLSPRQSPSRSTLVYVTHRQRDLNESVHRQLGRGGVDIALRDGNLRFSPHLDNTADDVDRALHLLGSLPRAA
jgi:cysteine desulfurase / selenocysteine lyase